MRTLRSRTTLLTMTGALALTLTACGSDDTNNSSNVASPAASTPAAAQTVDGISTEHNDADITFINDMTPHHKGAVGMAELAPTRAASPEVKGLAMRIQGAQQPELDRMQAMAKAWGITLTEGPGHGGGHSSGGDMSGMGQDADVAALTSLNGSAFDKEFLTRMIAHHQGALPMAQAVLDSGQNSQAKELATAILTTQKAEIAEMMTWLAAA